MSVYSRTETIGRVYLEGPGDLAHRLVRLEPVDAVLAADHELAGRDALRPRLPALARVPAGRGLAARYRPGRGQGRYSPSGNVIETGAMSGVPTSSWIWACAFSGMPRGSPW